ncbi:MAG: hypothetical protein WBE37_16260 [Bryobacteraceae bacterium]
MSRITWWLVDVAARSLEADEREAVSGDFAESGETGGQALRDVLGLVVRRQAELWKDWRPWLVLLGLVVPLGVLLSLVSRMTADFSSIYAWMYLNNWTWTYLINAGARTDLIHYGAGVALNYLALVCWSWTGGFVLGFWSRRTIAVNVSLFGVSLLLAELLGAPRYLGHWLLLPRPLDLGAQGIHSGVFSLAFYRVMFPLIVQMILVILPSMWGVRQGLRLASLRGMRRTILWACVLATVTALVTQNSVWWQVRTWEASPALLPHLPSLLPVALLGPIGYWLATARWNTRRAVSD